MATLDNYASDFVGAATLPRPRSIFTPAAFDQATSIADRARLASSNLTRSLKLAESESKMRDFVLKGMEQDSDAAKLYQDAELRAMQPALQQTLTEIDPADDDAFDKLTDIEQFALSPDLRRRVGSLKSASGVIRREKMGLIQRMQQGGYDLDSIEQTLKDATDKFRGGDPLAIQKASTGLRTYNEAESARRTSQWPQANIDRSYQAATTELAKQGLPSDPAQAEAKIRARLEEIKKRAKWVNPEKFLQDPEMALLDTPVGESNKAVIDALKNAARDLQTVKSAGTAIAARNRAVVERSESQNPVAGQTQNAYIQSLLSSLK